MNDFINYFNRIHKLEYRGVSIKRDLDWWMAYIGGKLFKLLFVVILLVLFVFIHLFWTKFSDNKSFPVQQIRLQGAFLLTNQEDVNQAIISQNEVSFYQLNLNQLVQSIENLAWVKKAQAKRMSNNQIGVAVVESTPSYKWKQDHLIDDEGRIFLNRLPHYFDFLPKLDGPWGKESEVTQSYDHLNGLLNEQQVDLVINRFEMNQYRSIVLYLNDGVMIKFGRDQFAQRANRFIKALKENKLPDLSKVTVVDMRYKNGFSVKWKEQHMKTINTQLVLLPNATEGSKL